MLTSQRLLVRLAARALVVLSTMLVAIVAMLLLAFVASYIARQQRRSRLAAIRLSTVDSLTGLFNRGFFFAAGHEELGDE